MALAAQQGRGRFGQGRRLLPFIERERRPLTGSPGPATKPSEAGALDEGRNLGNLPNCFKGGALRGRRAPAGGWWKTPAPSAPATREESSSHKSSISLGGKVFACLDAPVPRGTQETGRESAGKLEILIVEEFLRDVKVGALQLDGAQSDEPIARSF